LAEIGMIEVCHDGCSEKASRIDKRRRGLGFETHPRRASDIFKHHARTDVCAKSPPKQRRAERRSVRDWLTETLCDGRNVARQRAEGQVGGEATIDDDAFRAAKRFKQRFALNAA